MESPFSLTGRDLPNADKERPFDTNVTEEEEGARRVNHTANC